MPHAIQVHETGGPDVMRLEEVSTGDPGPGEARIRHAAVGLNYIDVYFRMGLYPAPSLPFAPGMEGAGEILALGEGVTDLAVGDRVAYAGSLGAYAQERIIPADRLGRVPDAVSDVAAASMMLQGMTVQYLLKSSYPVKAGDTVLFHAAAGGVGLIACQWAKHLGVTVIGTVGSDEKAELARAHGCEHPIVYTRENVVERVRELTGGAGVPVVYDSVGNDTFSDSLDCLRPAGTMVSFGQASGPIPPFDIAMLGAKGSLFLQRPTLMTYTARRADLLAMAEDLFEVVGSGAVRIRTNQTFPLAEAAQAHRALEGRRTTGSTVLVP
ncbi:MAG: quinone oxidoreductase [Immundisolibacterales bacterium]|nr:quinone oxidoreductase [Immundisolibacterales bacterium]